MVSCLLPNIHEPASLQPYLELWFCIPHSDLDLEFLNDSLFTLAVLREAKNKTLQWLTEVWTLWVLFVAATAAAADDDDDDDDDDNHSIMT